MKKARIGFADNSTSARRAANAILQAAMLQCATKAGTAVRVLHSRGRRINAATLLRWIAEDPPAIGMMSTSRTYRSMAYPLA